MSGPGPVRIGSSDYLLTSSEVAAEPKRMTANNIRLTRSEVTSFHEFSLTLCASVDQHKKRERETECHELQRDEVRRVEGIDDLLSRVEKREKGDPACVYESGQTRSEWSSVLPQ